jgi:sugar/nucleoside kinase (ribokinase family)
MGDTMNYWIEHNRAGLLKVIPRLNVFILSDGEAREICETANLIKAGRQLLKMGPKYIIIKKGEHGALLFHEDRIFSVPAYSYVDVVDPTGAGDSFAGGFMGYLARTGDLSEASVRRAVVFGCVMGSFNVEGFSMEKTRSLDMSTILERYEGLRQITVF